MRACVRNSLSGEGLLVTDYDRDQELFTAERVAHANTHCRHSQVFGMALLTPRATRSRDIRRGQTTTDNLHSTLRKGKAMRLWKQNKCNLEIKTFKNFAKAISMRP